MKTITVTDESYAYQKIDVRRSCRLDDIRIVYRVEFKVDKDLVESGLLVCEDFDEYFCGNCEEYFQSGGGVEHHLEV